MPLRTFALCHCGECADFHHMRFSERSFGVASVALGLVLIGVMSTALAAFDGMGAWVVALLGGSVLGMLVVMAGVGIVGVSKALGISEQQALVDQLTRLPSADKLTLDVAEVLDGDIPAVLSLYLLDGFKRYSEAYGRACGDAMLTWLAAKLRAATDGAATAYRMRGGEFAILAPGDEDASAAVRARAAAALTESGEGFVIAASGGDVVLPVEARTVGEALTLADHRASSRRRAARREDQPRPPEDPIETTRIGPSRFDVAELATEVGRRLGLAADRLDDLAAAAHLRDIGNMALPGVILGQDRELTETEWHFIRLHTLVGERLLSSNFAMEGVGRLVRSSHERFDGTGYPDGLAGDAIPLGARIVFVCTAFQDMTCARPHRAALDIDAALEELTEGAGTQFDRTVVEAFTEIFARTAGGRRTMTPAPPARHLRVLVADDDAASRFLLWRAVEAAGHECVTVTGGLEALETYRRERPDIVFCDARLPEIDGRELCGLIRAEPRAPQTYFVMLTALGDLGLIRSGAGAGADDYLTKPISREELDQRLSAAGRTVLAAGQTSTAG